MIKIKSGHLLVLLLLIWTEGSVGKKARHKNGRQNAALSDEKSVRSALIGIKPEDIATTWGKVSGGSRKSEVNLLDQLPAFQDEQRLTNSALDYSSQLSPLDQRIVKQFDKANAGSNDDSSPGVKTGGGVEGNNVNRKGRNFVQQVTRHEMGRAEFNPARDFKEDISALRNGGLDKDFYRQISQIEGDQPQASNVGKISDMYKNNPLPEYSYKESDYGEVSDVHSNDGGYDKYYKNPFELPRNPFEMPKDDFQLNSQDKELFKSLPNDQGDQHPSSSDNSDLYSMIGKKVILDLLKHQNDSQEHSEDNFKQNFLKKLMEGNSDQKSLGVDNLLVNKMTTTLSPNPFIGHFPTLPSHGNVLTSGKISSSEELTLGPQKSAQSFDLPKGINLNIQGHVFQGDPLSPSRMIKEQTPTVRQPPSAAVQIENKLKNVEMQPESTTLNDQLQTKAYGSKKENYVTLKISGAGKPVSFKAGTSNDGSLVLKIPGNVTLVDSATNKDIPGEAVLNESDGDNLKTKMATDAEQMNRYLLARQRMPTQEFAKKGNLFEGNDENASKEMLGWQILGKTNTRLNQEMEDNGANDVLHEGHNAVSSVRPTAGRALNGLFILPTSVHDLPQLAPTKYNELSRVSFAGVGKSPPSDLFPPSLRLRQNEENNKFLSLKTLLRPSKFIEDSAVNRGRLSVGPAHEKLRNSWSPCSVTCGQGVQARARLCEGTHCKGYRTQSKACFMQPCPEQLGRAGLRLHNKFRAWHRSPPLKWSNRLAAKAQRIANEMVDNSMRLADFETEHQGINVAEILNNYDIAAEKATAEWYSEVKSYNFEDPEISDSNKHFTQLIWKGSKKIGIGEAKSPDGKHTYVVAIYDPPGNVRSKQKSNVHLPTSQTD